MLGEYMTNKLFKTIGFFCFCTAIMAAGPQKALADQESPEYQTSTAMLIRVDDMSTDIHSEPSEDSEIVGQAHTGATYDVLELVDGQWAKISAGDFEHCNGGCDRCRDRRRSCCGCGGGETGCPGRICRTVCR